MSLVGLVSDSLDTAFAQIGDIAKSVTFTSVATGTYNPTTGARGGTSTAYTIQKAVVAGYRANQIDGTNIQANDQKVIFRANEITGVTVRTDDTITIGSTVWKIVRARKDPTDSLWIAQVRQ